MLISFICRRTNQTAAIHQLHLWVFVCFAASNRGQQRKSDACAVLTRSRVRCISLFCRVFTSLPFPVSRSACYPTHACRRSQLGLGGAPKAQNFSPSIRNSVKCQKLRRGSHGSRDNHRGRADGVGVSRLLCMQKVRGSIPRQSNAFAISVFSGV